MKDFYGLCGDPLCKCTLATCSQLRCNDMLLKPIRAHNTAWLMWQHTTTEDEDDCCDTDRDGDCDCDCDCD